MKSNTISEQASRPLFSVELDIHWGDMDALGHLNNVFYYRYMEEARIQWMQSFGERIRSAESGPVLYNSSCTYLKPVVYPEKLRIDLFSGEVKRSSFDLLYAIYASSSTILVARAQTKIVWVDYKKMKSVSLPSIVKSNIESKP